MQIVEYTPSSCEQDLLLYIDKTDLLRLEQVFGGQTIYIAAKPKEELIEAVGIETANTLTEVYKTTYLCIPKVLLRFIRNREIHQEIISGSSIHDLAAKFKLKTPAIKAMLVKYYGYKTGNSSK